MKIEIKNLVKPYNKDFSIINDISVSLDLDKEVVVFAGDEGAGKTTLLNIIAGVEKDYEGDVIIDGVNRREYKNENNEISYIMEEPLLFNYKSVLKNLLYVFKIKDKKYDKDKAISEIKEIAFELGITDLLSKKGKKLNNFEKQLVSLARFYLKKSKLLIMDEPLNGLKEVEKSCLLNKVFFLTRKLSSGLVLADNGQNIGYFEDAKILRMDYGGIS